MNCPVCRGGLKEYRELHDDRYGYPGTFRLGSCENCGHDALLAHFDQKELAALYTDYYPRSTFDPQRWAPASDRRGFAAWLDGVRCSAFRWVPRGVRILDVGCGFGESLGYHRLRGCDVYGVEADENIRKVAELHGFRVHVGLFDPGLYPAGFFDYVTLDQVIEHVGDPLETLRGVAQVLKPGGTAIVSTPNSRGICARLFGRRWINWHAPYHLQHFSEKSMRMAAAAAGLRLEKVRNVTSSEWLLYQWIHLATFPAPGEISPFWSPHRKRGRGVTLLLAIFTGIHLFRVNHLVTRLWDALGLGDNNLYFLGKDGR